MKSILIAAAIALSVVSVGTAQANEALAKANGCMTCHDIDKKKMGPSFKDISAKYKGKADAEAKVVDALANAKGHPAVKAKGDDLKQIVKWSLSQ